MSTNTVNILVGRRATGKTTYLKEVVYLSPLKRLIFGTLNTEDWHNFATIQHPERAAEYIPEILPEQIERFDSGTVRVFRGYPLPLDTVKQIAAHVYNALIVFEDARRYVGSSMPATIQQIVTDSKQKGLNIIFVYHSLRQVPPELIDLADTLTLFNTNDIKVPDKFAFPQMDVLVKHVQNSAKKDPYFNISIRIQ